MSYEICFTRRFSMAHRLHKLRDSRCYVPHGHNEYVKVTLITHEVALDGDHNMAAPFEQMKKRWHRWIDDHVDHGLQLSATDPLLSYFKEHEAENLKYLLISPGDPTTELLCALFKSKIEAFLVKEGLNMSCKAVEIEETPTNTVVFTGDPLPVINMCNYTHKDEPWWVRADMSINDL